MSGIDDALGTLLAPSPQQAAAPPAAVAAPTTHIDDALQALTAPTATPTTPDQDQNYPQMTQEKPAPGPGAGGMGFLDSLVAAMQGTSPVVKPLTGPNNYQLAPAKEQWAFQEAGVPTDQQKYVALRDPQSGQYQVYNRSQDTNEGAMAGMGRVMSLATPETGIPSVAETAVPSAAQNLMQDFKKMNVPANLPAVGQGRTSALTSQIGNTLPVTGPVVRNAANQTMQGTQEAVSKLATGMGAATGPLEGGGALQNALNMYVKQQFPQEAGNLYDAFNQQMAGVGQVPLTNTLKVLGAPMQRFPTSPALGAQLTNTRLQSFQNTLAPSTTNVPPVLSKVLDTSGNPMVLQAAQKIQSGGTLTFPELQELRSTVGRAISDPMLVNDIPRADLKNVYGGISQDLESAAGAQSPQALDAFHAANDYYKQGMQKIDALAPLLSGSPEQSFARINSAAGSSAGANVGLLNTAKSTMAPADWQNVGAAVIRRLGEPTPGAKDILSEGAPGGGFSASSFATNWNKISPDAKDILFGVDQSRSTRSDIESLARISQAQKNVSKLANASHSGEYGLTGGLAALAFEHRDALMAHPLSTVGGILGARMTAKALMSPGFANWLYQMPATMAKAPSFGVGAQRVTAGLQQVTQTNPELAPVWQALTNGTAGPQQPAAQAP